MADDARRDTGRLELEGLLQDDRLKDEDRTRSMARSRHSAAFWIPRPWHTASQTFYRIDNRPDEPGSLLVH